MATSKQGYHRRHPRVAIECAATVADDTGAYAGMARDISVGGAAVELEARVNPSTSVMLRVDPAAAIHPGLKGGLPPLPGVVQSIRLVGASKRTGAPLYRMSIAFRGVSKPLTERLRALAPRRAPTGRASRLAREPEGREILYQAACEHLAAGRFAPAAKLICPALRGDPDNLSYRELAFRAQAEVLLARGKGKAALALLERARHSLHDGAALGKLEDRARALPPAREGSGWAILHRLFRWRDPGPAGGTGDGAS